MKNSTETQERLESAGLDVMDYELYRGRYHIKLHLGEAEKIKRFSLR